MAKDKWTTTYFFKNGVECVKKEKNGEEWFTIFDSKTKWVTNDKFNNLF